jgi:hypothetical protein
MAGHFLKYGAAEADFGSRNAGDIPVDAHQLNRGGLAWRQHDGGHTDGPNWKHFIPWADRMMRTR